MQLAEEPGRQADGEQNTLEAIERFRQAIKTAPGHDDSWKWREKLAQLLSDRLGNIPEAEKRPVKDEAMKLASDALKLAPTNEDKDRIGRIRGEIQGK
jgi:hypothetical protein